MAKLKIAVFGDSYADTIGIITNAQLAAGDIPWVSMLKELSDNEITNFALLGTSFQYSAKLFFDNFHKYDKIIFVVTYPGRFYISNPDLDPKLVHIANLEHLFYRVDEYKRHAELNTSGYDKSNLDFAMPYLTALKDYYYYLYDYDQNKMFHDALYEKIERTLPRE